MNRSEKKRECSYVQQVFHATGDLDVIISRAGAPGPERFFIR
jgi:hypothetical protein